MYKPVLGSWSVPGPLRIGSSTPRGYEWLFLPRLRTHFRFSSTSCSLFPRDSFRFRTGSIIISSSISYHDGMRTFEWRISYVFNTVWNSYLCAATVLSTQTIGWLYEWMYKIFRYRYVFISMAIIVLSGSGTLLYCTTISLSWFPSWRSRGLIIRRVSSRRSREFNGRNYSSGRKDSFFVARLHLG